MPILLIPRLILTLTLTLTLALTLTTLGKARSNRCGGVQGGISNGENIVERVAFNPASTIGREQDMVAREGEGGRERRREGPAFTSHSIHLTSSLMFVPQSG